MSDEESTESSTQFWIGSVAVPIILAVVSGIIVWSTGIFDAQSKLIDAEKIEFKSDTTRYANEKYNILVRLVKLTEDSAKLSSNILEKEKIIEITDSILKVRGKSASDQQKQIIKLTYDNQVLQSTLNNYSQNSSILTKEIERLKNNNSNLVGNINKFFQSWDPWVIRLNKRDSTAIWNLSYINSEANDIKNAVKYFGQ